MTTTFRQLWRECCAAPLKWLVAMMLSPFRIIKDLRREAAESSESLKASVENVRAAAMGSLRQTSRDNRTAQVVGRASTLAAMRLAGKPVVIQGGRIVEIDVD